MSIRCSRLCSDSSSAVSSWHRLSLLLAAVLLLSAVVGRAETDTCLAVQANNLVKNLDQGSLYMQFSAQRAPICAGDRLEYDIFLAPDCPLPKGGIDVEFDKGPCLCRVANRGVKDQNGLAFQGDALLKPAVGKWYHRVFPLDAVAGRTAVDWEVCFRGGDGGTYTQFLDNIAIVHSDGTKTFIYENGSVPLHRIGYRDCYSRFVVTQPVPRAAVTESADIQTLMAPAIERQRCMDSLAELGEAVALAQTILKQEGKDTPEALVALRNTSDTLAAATSGAELSETTAADTEKSAKTVLMELLGPEARRYTGHLVGHAHIDAQWLWEWPETLDEFRNTFAQALRFMDEFPRFTFTQSSSMFYQATEYRWPQLFKEIQKRVKSGRWEIVGGRITEADNNLISPEAEAREFLYGQRFFRERFGGKQAVVAWEPDTFGHNAQMPQIVKLGGCDYYYFCRCGKDLPLFWWQGLDGTRILAFQEVNSWYNGTLDNGWFQELPEFRKRTGSRDALWVYGVGDHGGGPTREDLEVAMDWKKKPYLPRVKFSTATEFFKTVSDKYDLSGLPTVRGELNFIFRGCYTTHGDIKRWNDDAEALAESAEAIAAIAARYGFPYPGTAIRQAWEDICWNHHHDTIDGTAINPAYRRSREVFARAMSTCRLVGSDALGFLATQVKTERGRILVFNPVGSTRDAAVECVIPDDKPLEGIHASGNGDVSPIQILDPQRRQGLFIAHQLPSYGYRVYEILSNRNPQAPGPAARVSPDGTVLENDNLRVTIDPTSGTIVGLYDKQAERELLPRGGTANRLEIHWENNGADAWTIGHIDRVESLGSPVTPRVVEAGPARVAVEFARPFRTSTITQRVALTARGDAVECAAHVDWKETALNKPAAFPFLKAAFDFNIPDATSNYEIAFGNVMRPIDGAEVPALKWMDVGNRAYGLSVLCDAKHGWSVTTNTLRLSLVRTPPHPDPTSDNYPQSVAYALYPHRRDWKAAGAVARAFEWVHPVWTTITTGKGPAVLPADYSFVAAKDSNVMITAVKRAEDDNDLVVRLYESEGTPVEATLKTAWPVQAARSVNFLEDTVPGDAAADDAGVSAPLHPYEIKTLKLEVAPVEGVTMIGTRGSGPPRPF